MDIQYLATIGMIIIFLFLVLVASIVYGIRAMVEGFASKKKEKENMEAEDKEMQEVYLDTDIEIGRVTGHVKDYRFEWLKINGRKYHTYEQLTKHEALTPYELEQFELVMEFMGEKDQVVQDKQPIKPYVSFKPRNFHEGDGHIYIYQTGIDLSVSKRMTVYVNKNKKGEMFIHRIAVAENDIFKDLAYEPYMVGNEDGTDNVDQWALYQENVEKYKGDGAWGNEIAAIRELRDRLYIYNKNRHRIRVLGDGRYEFLPEAKKKPATPTPQAPTTPSTVPNGPTAPSPDNINYGAL